MKLRKKIFPYAFILLCFTWSVLMVLVVPVDYEWTLVLREHRIPSLDQFMDHTIFEGEPVGGGDPVICLLLLVAGASYLAWKFGPKSRFYAWRPHLGFILTSALICSVMMVHSLKWVMGRARPSQVVKDYFPFSDWFVFGPRFITEGTYQGSFPSGHTAQAFVLVTIAYALATAFHQTRAVRLIGWLWGGIAGCFVVLMGISRCMTMNHWLSDVLGAIGISWILMHAIYFWMLKIPEQIEYYERQRRYPSEPVVWELRLCVHVFGMVLGGMAVMLGVRAVILGAHWALFLPIPAGILLLIFFQKRFTRLYRKAMDGFSLPDSA
jgi:membrane-associated phospholipid phosphatase